MQPIVAELTRVSGLEQHHPVPCAYLTREQVTAFLKNKMKRVATPAEIRADELTLKKFGLVPQDFKLQESTVDLLTEQAAAFYDYDRKKLFITDSTPGDSEEMVLAHELAHALADQEFNLGKFVRKARESDDGSAARLAVMEGQATWLMSEYVARKAGRSLADSPELVEAMANLGNATGQFPVYDRSPLYLRLTLVFPYTKGVLFQNAVFRRDGVKGFSEVFRNPPVSTAQILHPAMYFEGLKPAEMTLPQTNLPRAYKSLVTGSMGELDTGALLEQYLGKERAAEMAGHWRGARFELRENPKANRVVLLYAAQWDSEESARRYFAMYREVLEKKWSRIQIETADPALVRGTGDDGRFELRVSGGVVTSVEGLDPGLH